MKQLNVMNQNCFSLKGLTVSFIASFLTLSIFSQSLANASVCDDPLKGELCYNMRYLRTQVMALGEQRELMQVNYPYLGVIGEEINAITQFLIQGNWLEADHAEGIELLQAKVHALKSEAGNEDPMALATANVIQKKCASCHSPANPSSGTGWDQIFKNDWAQIAKNCSKEGRTPYLCRSMNGMMTAYASIFAANQLGRESYPSLQQSALELARIAQDLQEKKLFHGAEFMMKDVEDKAREVVRLASQKDPEAFTKGQWITQACMQCHGNFSLNKQKLSFSPFSTSVQMAL